MSNIAVLTWERWINPESCTQKREITLADLKEKQCRGNTLYITEICIVTMINIQVIVLWSICGLDTTINLKKKINVFVSSIKSLYVERHNFFHINFQF